MKKLPGHSALLCLTLSCFFSSLAFGQTNQALRWDTPRFITESGRCFPASASSKTVSALIWQEVHPDSSGVRGVITLTGQFSRDGLAWIENRTFTPPYPYDGDIPSIASLAVTASGDIAVAIQAPGQGISVLTSGDFGETFQEQAVRNGEYLTAPRIFAAQNGGLMLLAVKNDGNNLALYDARSQDGKTWTRFTPFAPAASLAESSVPTIIPFSGGDMAVFQAAMEHNGSRTFQLYSAISADGGLSWSEARLVSGPESLLLSDRGEYTAWHNQRAAGYELGGRLYLAWERTNAATGSGYIATAQLNPQGQIIPGSPERAAESGSGQTLFAYRGSLYLTYSALRGRREAAFLARRGTAGWIETVLSAQDAAFVCPALLAGGEQLALFWQSGGSKNLAQGRIIRLLPAGAAEPWIRAAVPPESEAGETLKTGGFRHTYTPFWQLIFRGASIPVADVLLWIIAVLAVLGFALSLWALVKSGGETRSLRRTVQALLREDALPREYQTGAAKTRGLSMGIKLAGVTVSLALMAVLGVSIPLGIIMGNAQEQALTRGLRERAGVLLDSLASQAGIYLPQQNILELAGLPAGMNSLDEARQATITGLPRQGGGAHIDHVWATNDPDIAQKIDTETFVYGVSRLINGEIEGLNVLNAQAAAAAGRLSNALAALTAQALPLIQLDDQGSRLLLDELQSSAAALNRQINETLGDMSRNSAGSIPAFDPRRPDRRVASYLFYQPVLYRRGSEQTFVRGMVFVEISMENLFHEIDQTRFRVLLTALSIGILVLLAAVTGALVLSSLIVLPIRRLTVHVALVRDTENKETLRGREIAVTGRDEIALLGQTINGMTESLAKAALDTRDLRVGKEVQKMFIPLETDGAGRKLTSGALDDPRVRFFGYYEARGVSGDYFDYRKLDDRWFAFIKCDVSGKGVPASLIMVEVASLFLNYCEDWHCETRGASLAPLVARINSLIESRGFIGRFAAFTLGLFDSLAGSLFFCNAGDSAVHVYRRLEGGLQTAALKSAPAAGVFSNQVIESQGGFPVSSLRLEPGDVLFLYTDGIEESRRSIRDRDVQPVGGDREELGAGRVKEIIEAVFSHSSWFLQKRRSPFGTETLEFDFSSCRGAAQEAILALVSVEKVFRMYHPAKAGVGKVLVDRKIDEFLSRCFKQYDDYCPGKMDNPKAPEYVCYTPMCEDPQYDDLALLGIERMCQP
jgi:serine phosphatase RsbU (regulator of sigma subunit)